MVSLQIQYYRKTENIEHVEKPKSQAEHSTFDINNMGEIKEEDEPEDNSDEEVKADEPAPTQNGLSASNRNMNDDIPGNQPWVKHTSIKVLTDPAVLSRACRVDSKSLANDRSV